MARLPRLVLPGYPHHVIQRGNNRQITFHHRGDYECLLELLGEYAEREQVEIHAYVLMTNHFHLLVTPRTREGLSAMMQGVGRRYVQSFNKIHQRTGTLWEGRFRGTPIQTERYLMACMAYIDLNPVRAGMVSHPREYPWSSYRHYAGLGVDRLLKPHPLYWELGNTPFAREAAYTAFVDHGISAAQQSELTESTVKGWVLGDRDFVDLVQKKTERRVMRESAGRPFSKLEKL